MSIDYSVFKYSKNARIKDKKIINTKLHTCELCNKKKTYTNTHHIKSVGSGGDDTKENTIELCSNCHRLVHDGKISKLELLKKKKENKRN